MFWNGLFWIKYSPAIFPINLEKNTVSSRKSFTLTRKHVRSLMLGYINQESRRERAGAALDTGCVPAACHLHPSLTKHLPLHDTQIPVACH